MKGINIDSMTIDELSTLEDAIRETLAARIADQTSILEKRLKQLIGQSKAVRGGQRRPPSPISESASEISQPRPTFRNMEWARQTTPLVSSAAAFREADWRLSDRSAAKR